MPSSRAAAPGNVAKQIDLLLLVPSALAFVAMSLYWYFAGFAQLNEFHQQARLQLELARSLAAPGRGAVSEADRKRLREASGAFERSLPLLERDFERLERHLSDTSVMEPKIAAIAQAYAEIRPAIDRLGARSARSDWDTAPLLSRSRDLLLAIEAQRERRFISVMQICGLFFLALVLARRLAMRKIAAPVSALGAEFERVRNAAEAELSHVETLTEHLSPGILTTTPDLKVISGNRSFLEMFHRTGHEVIGRDLEESLPIPDLPRKAKKVLEAGESHCEEVLVGAARGDARYRVTLSPSRAPNGDLRLIAIFEDITELTAARKHGGEVEQRYREQMQQSADGVIMLNRGGVVTGLNRAAERMFGYTQSEVMGRPLGIFAQRGAEAFAGLSDKATAPIEFEAIRKSGATFPAEIAVQNPRTGKQSLLICAVRDLTERKRLEFLERDCLSVLEMVTKNRNLDSLLSELINMIERQYPSVRCSISLLRDGRLFVAAAPGLPEGFVQTIDGLPMGPSSCSCGTAAFTREMVVAADITNDPLWGPYQHLGHAHEIRSAWSVPIFSGLGTVLGTFAMYRRMPGKPGEGEIYMMEMASRLSAVAIEQRQLTERLTFQANHDTLTALPNRALFSDRLQQSIARARRNGTMVGLLFIDLDRFKKINDTLGHGYGDILLQQVSQRLQSAIRADDTLARMGGDEFAVIIDLPDRADAAREVARKLLDALSSPFTIAGKDLFVTASVGISIYPVDGQDAASLLRYSDSAMYRAKERSKNSFQRFTPDMGDVLRQQLDLEHDLHRAIEHGELSLHYQPQFNVKGGKLAAWETLLRWRHPSLGMIMPGQFIPAAEECGLIEEIGSWVLECSCKQNREWQRAGLNPLPIGVNMSSLQLERGDFVDTVARVLKESDLDPSLIELEVTESVLMKDPERFGSRLKELRDLGVTIAIDDFGTGYSSLSYLQHLPFHTLKIDRSFMSMIKPDGGEPVLIDSIVNLTHNLGMTVTAEGVETAAQLEALTRTGCDRAQGYLLSKVLSAGAAEALLAKESERRLVASV